MWYQHNERNLLKSSLEIDISRLDSMPLCLGELVFQLWKRHWNGLKAFRFCQWEERIGKMGHFKSIMLLPQTRARESKNRSVDLATQTGKP